jgi:hypothetical protein
MPKENDVSAFSYFLDSERIEEIRDKYSNAHIPSLVVEAQDGEQDIILFLVAECFKSVRSGFLANKEFHGNDHIFLSKFFKKLLFETNEERGPFHTADIVDTTKEDQLEQLGIEFYTFAKSLTVNEEIGSPFPEGQETHTLLAENGLFAHLYNIKPEYAKILRYMTYYTPSDEICDEMNISSLHTLKSKIRAIRQLVDHYFNQEERRDDDYLLAK